MFKKTKKKRKRKKKLEKFQKMNLKKRWKKLMKDQNYSKSYKISLTNLKEKCLLKMNNKLPANSNLLNKILVNI